MESGAPAEVTQSEAHDAAAIARAYFEAIDARDMDRATALWQPGSNDELSGIAELRAPEEIKAYFEGLFRSVPDLSLEVRSITTEGDRAAVHWKMTGTFNGTGKLLGLAPNGRPLSIEGIDLLTIAGGKITSNLAHTNGVVLARQLGVLPNQDTLLERAMYAPFNLIAGPLKALRRRRTSPS